jgi:hypothetical protein
VYLKGNCPMTRAPVLTLVPQPARWPQIVQRFTHALAQASSPLNEESIALAYLYQHATTKTRRRLYAVLRANGCDCLACGRHRARAAQAQGRA